jgi:hypothetical protein
LVFRKWKGIGLHSCINTNGTSKHDGIINIFAISGKVSSESDVPHVVGEVKIEVSRVDDLAVSLLGNNWCAPGL